MIAYPIDVTATARQWASYRISTSEVLAWGLSWPRSDGGPRQGAAPDIAYLLVSDPRPTSDDTDVRFRDIVAGPVTIEVDPLPDGAPADQGRVGSLTRTYTTPLKAPDQILAAVSEVATSRMAAAVEVMGIRTPSDILLAVNAVRRKADGLPLNTRQQALLDRLGLQTQEWLDSLDAAEQAILAWCVAHPGEMPDVSESAWPALPTAA